RIGDGHPAGWFPVSDALCHTDPVLAHGLSFALIHARALRDALGRHSALADASAAYCSDVMPLALERFVLATLLDEQRLRMWVGGDVDSTRRDGDAALFTMVAGGAVAFVDPEVFRVFLRRFGLLDSTRVLDDDEGLKERIERQFRELIVVPRPPAGPSREEM